MDSWTMLSIFTSINFSLLVNLIVPKVISKTETRLLIITNNLEGHVSGLVLFAHVNSMLLGFYFIALSLY